MYTYMSLNIIELLTILCIQANNEGVNLSLEIKNARISVQELSLSQECPAVYTQIFSEKKCELSI